MNIKTKKIQLDPKIYRRVGLSNVVKNQWWLPLSIFGGIIVFNLLLNLVYTNTWIFYLAPVGLLGYYLFWWIQFTGAPHLEQMKPMFERMNYEINGKEILMKKSAREGMQMKWEMIKSVKKTKDAFILVFSQAQFIYLPFKAFNSEHDIRKMEAIIRRKNLIS